MKKYLLILLLFALSSNLLGQETPRKGYIGILMGPSFPFGEFSATGQFYTGYAKSGLNINLVNFGYKFGRNLGIAAAWTGAAYPRDFFGADGMWGVGTLMAGPMLSFPIGKSFELDFKAMFAYTLLTLKREYSNDTSSTTGLGYDFGTMLHWNFKPKWALLLDFGTFFTKELDLGPRISVFNTLLGIAYRLK